MSDTKQYTQADLDVARAELRTLEEHFLSYSGNNPDKYQRKIQQAREWVRALSAYLA